MLMYLQGKFPCASTCEHHLLETSFSPHGGSIAFFSISNPAVLLTPVPALLGSARPSDACSNSQFALIISSYVLLLPTVAQPFSFKDLKSFSLHHLSPPHLLSLFILLSRTISHMLPCHLCDVRMNIDHHHLKLISSFSQRANENVTHEIIIMLLMSLNCSQSTH